VLCAQCCDYITSAVIKQNVYSFILYNIDIYIIIYNRLFKSIYIDYNVIEFFKDIIFYYNIYKRVLFIIYNVYNKFNKYIYN
jgi:hypothetical protein